MNDNTVNGLSPIFIILAGLALVIYLIIQNAKKRQLHSDAMLQFTLMNQLEFSVYDSLSLINRYFYSKLIQQGHHNEASNLIYGKIKNRDFIFFDYKYRVGSGKNERTYEFAVVTVEMPVLFSYLFIRPETVLDKIAGAVGFDDINFESDEFSKAFHVKSYNKKFAYDIIHSATMQLLLENRGWTIEINSNSIIFYKPSIFMIGDYEIAAAFANKFIDIIPEYLLKNISIS